ncbi:hypothetical protein DCC81_20365 [Chitinophaga parva]|uniref:Uncharacterized protein n=1 Tax=Chitinophaga parva TaxID=2169414 RepID=A0A2T7BCG0_9BACT|nr:fasciclin domain-containing protein [Chitinophaga parva]PUZ22784.1 hypothetical protein DCC81_20365 [Chitinophaga parva]
MKKHFITGMGLLLMVLVFCASCNKDYIVGGVKTDPNQYKNTSTYDVMKGNPLLFDTVLQLIDAAGIKDQVNASGTTFFAPTDNAVYYYMQSRTVLLQGTVDQYAKFGLDSLLYYLKNNIDGTRDSLQMYLVHTPLPFSALTNHGTKYPTGLLNDTAIVSYEFTKDENLGYNSLVSNVPQVEYYTHLWAPFPLGPNLPIDSMPSEIGVHSLMQTAGVTTQNGVLNVFATGHILFFYGTKQ